MNIPNWYLDLRHIRSTRFQESVGEGLTTYESKHNMWLFKGYGLKMARTQDQPFFMTNISMRSDHDFLINERNDHPCQVINSISCGQHSWQFGRRVYRLTRSDYTNIYNESTAALRAAGKEMLESLSVRTFGDLLNVRSLTGVMRINEHFIARGLSPVNLTEDFLVDGLTPEKFKQLTHQLIKLGYIVELRSLKTEYKSLVGFRTNAEKGTTPTDAELTDVFLITHNENIASLHFYSAYEDQENINEILQLLNEFKVSEPLELTYVTGFDEKGEAKLSVRKVEEQDIDLDLFYPYITEGIEPFLTKFAESKSNMVLFYGEAGTGKTTLFRHMLKFFRSRQLYQFSGDKVLSDPNFDSYIASLPEHSLALIEDGDNLLKKRSSGNSSMSLILNELDGVAKRDIVLLVSANLSTTNEIDGAVLRGGRCFRSIRCRKLNPDQIERLRAVVEFKNEVPVGESATLSDLLADKNEGIEDTGLGFRNEY